MKLILSILLAACCSQAAQVQLVWSPSNSTNPVVIYSTTNVTYTLASLTATTNRVRQSWYSPNYGYIVGNQVLASWAYYYSSLEQNTLVTPDMLSGWTVLTTRPENTGQYMVTLDNSRMRFFTVQDGGSGSVELGWDAASLAFNVTGYRLYWGGSSRNYTNVMLLGKVTTTTVTGLVKGSTNYFALTAIGAGGESGYSSEVKAPVARQDYQVFIKRI